jgi:hypothetical protein
MPVLFPTIRAPITRSLRPGVFPVRRFAGQTGAIVTTIRGDRANELELVLGFPYIADEQAALIWATWHATLGGFREVTLPDTALQGIDSALVAQIPPYVGWYMSAPPEVTSVQPGLSRMEVRFAGRLAGAGGEITVAPDTDPLDAPCTSFDPEAYAFVRWNGVKAAFTDGYIEENETTLWYTAGPGYSYSRRGGPGGDRINPSGTQPAWTASLTITQTNVVGGVWTALHLDRLSPTTASFDWGYPVFRELSGGPFPVILCYCVGVWEFSNDTGVSKTVMATWPGFTVP